MRLNLKNRAIKQISNVIEYSIPLHVIHYQVAKRLLLIYHTAEAIISHNDSAGQISQFQHERNAVFYNKFQIPPNITFVEEELTKRIARVNYTVNKDIKPNAFENLTRIFLVISERNCDIVDQFAIMLAKIFIGRPYLNYLDKNTNHLSLIITDNSRYIRDFLMNIFSYNILFDSKCYNEKIGSKEYKYAKKNMESYYHVTEYSAAMLSDEKNIGEFIKDKNMGNIVNIDTTRSSAGPNFKSLVEGTLISCNDPYFGKLQYRSNAHYIRINQNIRQSGIENYNILYDIIHCDGNLTNAIYEPLEDYELFFLVTGFVNYGIDLLSQPDSELSTTLPTPNELVDEFIESFCIDTTNTISLAREISGLEDEAKRLAVAKDEGITQLSFTHVDTLIDYFDKWCAIAYQDIHYDKTTIKNCFINKYPKVFYLKKRALTPSGKSKDARGIYGLKFEIDKFKSFTNTADTQFTKASPEEFISYMGNIIANYLPVDKKQKSSC